MKRVTVALVLTFVAVTAAAQLREKTTVEVVEVPVYVTANGEPVSTLTRDNFALFVNGRQQRIDYFDTIDHAAVSAAEKPDVRQRRLYMLVFDLLSTPKGLYRAQKATVDFIDKAEENDTIGVATLGQKGMKIVVPFTRDRIAVRRAVRNLVGSKVNDPLHLTISVPERGEEMGRPDRMNDPRFNGGVTGEPTDDYLALIDTELYDLGDLASRLAGMEGYKHVVFFSSGFDSEILTGIAGRQHADVRTGPTAQPLRTFGVPMNPPIRSINAALLKHMRGMREQFTAAGVFLDAIDIEGVRPFMTISSNESLYAMVRGTGGDVIDRTNNLGSAIRTLTARQRVVYVLGFHAAATGKEQNKIEVKLVNVPRGTRAVYRPSYTSIANQPDSADPLRLADIIINDIPQNGLTTNVAVEPGSHAATLDVTVPGRELLAQANSETVGAQAMLYIANGTSVVAFKVKRIQIDVPKAQAALESAAIHVREDFDLPPGAYAAKVLVRIDGSGALGYARADFTIAQ